MHSFITLLKKNSQEVFFANFWVTYLSISTFIVFKMQWQACKVGPFFFILISLGTIHLRRRQIFTIFDPYPPTIGILAKCLWRRFFILMYCDLSTIGNQEGPPYPPKTCRRLKWMVPYRSDNNMTYRVTASFIFYTAILLKN